MPTRAAVVVGINYSGLPPAGMNTLRYAEADAQAMAGVLTAEGYRVAALLGALATRRNIIDTLRRQRAAAGRDGLLVVYFAPRAADHGARSIAPALPVRGPTAGCCCFPHV